MPGDRERSEAGTDASSGEERVADRIAVLRERLGMSRNELALRAGMSLVYLREVENRAGDFDPDALARLAGVLEVSLEELTAGRPDAPPGRGSGVSRPVLQRLSTQECWQRLGTHGIGRIGYSAGSATGAPVVVPVNFFVDGRSVVYRTDPAGAAGVPADVQVAFEVDHIDEATGVGWSVLITGTVEHPADHDALEAVARHLGAGPWAGGRRDLWVRVRPREVSGRVIRQMLAQEPPLRGPSAP
ncbi:pyridoxamine 5'-phosphate oxidase family protein [Streptomyces sp. NBC_01723]|uniref:helix-turn-helix domain-containing protein n=1 Tax=Streptomyces sp. NBC_01723 TaxID=2975921 RepID=UPI002E3445B1|nr:pyridoxamine 5'-phosphate oxidase family protein [Streptomyces sp. NBC_01723]